MESDSTEPDGGTPFDGEGLLLTNIRTRDQLFIAEARNISKAALKYLAAVPSERSAPFTLDWSYRLHREMFGDVWEWAGKKRTTQKNIGVPANQIDSGLKDLFDDLAAWREHKSYSSIEQAARLHHRAVSIHPFNNGNGRWSRLLADIHLKQSGSQPTMWLENINTDESAARKEYIAALKAADKSDYSKLIQLHEKYSR
jgi:Fic-DOC domain mobile mystery protein B